VQQPALSEGLNNVTLADVYFCNDKAILRESDKIKKQTVHQHRLPHQKEADNFNHTNKQN
jgi:hypothetical protein